jgi:hypothetical protein
MASSSLASSPSAKLGVYRGAVQPGLVADDEAWLGHKVAYALDFFAMDNWSKIEDPGWWLAGWSASRYKQRMVYAVPLFPASRGSLAKGAAGGYNVRFRRLAQRLVSFGQPRAILRLGWEFNGGWYRWAAASDPRAFAAYWRQIVTTMRAVPGANFKFDWNLTLGWEQFPAARAYPGDAYVDYIGVDAYDQSWISNYRNPVVRWRDMLTRPYGLLWHRRFAAAHGKPMSYPEWGVTTRPDGHGGGDNPYYVRRMHEWIAANKVAYHIYFNFNAADGNHQLRTTEFPRSTRAFKRLFGSRRL